MIKFVLNIEGIDEYNKRLKKYDWWLETPLFGIIFVILAAIGIVFGILTNYNDWAIWVVLAVLTIGMLILILFLPVWNIVKNWMDKAKPNHYYLNNAYLEYQKKGCEYKGYSLEFDYDLVTIYYNNTSFNCKFANMTESFDLDEKLQVIQNENKMHYLCMETAVKQFHIEIENSKKKELKKYWKK